MVCFEGPARLLVDTLGRVGTSEISRDMHTEPFQTGQGSLAGPSKHTSNNSWAFPIAESTKKYC